MTDPVVAPLPPAPTPRRFTPPKPGESISNGDRTYVLGPVVGEGHFGTVYEATDDWGNELVAKVLRPLDRSYDAVRASWERELRTLETLRHPNITFLYAAFEYRDTFYLILERCSENLHSLISLPGLVPEGWLPWLARDILHAIHFMHGRRARPTRTSSS
jgi:serine/threonine protein kinase